jgi:hypothetical protein
VCVVLLHLEFHDCLTSFCEASFTAEKLTPPINPFVDENQEQKGVKSMLSRLVTVRGGRNVVSAAKVCSSTRGSISVSSLLILRG